MIFENRKRWNRRIVNGMLEMECNFILGIGRTGRVFHLFCPLHSREWNSWKNWNSCDRFRWALDFYSGIEWFLSHLKWNRWRSECLFQLFFFLKSLKRNAVLVNNSFKTSITALRPLVPHSHQKLGCLKSGVRVGSLDPFFSIQLFLWHCLDS